jgi:hypothetical protein
MRFASSADKRRLSTYLPFCDRASRYSTATSRALYKAIEELERLQAARKAREGSASSTDGEVATPSAEANEEQPEKQAVRNALGDTSSLAEPEDALETDEAA